MIMFHQVRDAVAARAAAHRRHRRLVRELATYDTPAQRLELDAVLARHAPEDTREVDAILTGLARERTTRHRAVDAHR